MTTIKAVRVHNFNGLDQVQLDTIARPKIEPSQVLVRVHAAGVNPVDWQLSYGINQEFMGRVLPTTLGFDMSGVVEHIGAEVSDFTIGDKVYGQMDYRFDGSFADYIATAPERLSPMPNSLSFIEAAAVPVGAMAAWDGLFRADAINLQPNQTVLITAAAGGVGVFAVQLAKCKGARVIATGSAHSRDFLLGLGADRFVDYNSTEIDQLNEPIHAVLDAVGGTTQLKALKIIAAGGVLASLVGEQWLDGPERNDVTKMVVHGGFIPDQLPHISALLESGAVKPVVQQVFALDDFLAAFKLSQNGHVRGKIVLQVA